MLEEETSKVGHHQYHQETYPSQLARTHHTLNTAELLSKLADVVGRLIPTQRLKNHLHSYGLQARNLLVKA
ncbi:hypothetical protein Trydic_g1894 [Trypoxylus dichotomus]